MRGLGTGSGMMTRDAQEAQSGRLAWLKADFDGKPVAFWLVIAAVIAVAVIGFGVWWGGGKQTTDTMGSMAAADAPAVPAVFGYHAGKDIRFIHTEASDPQVAGMLTMMMGSPVLTVPALSQVPPAARAKVYVFANGVKPDGTPAGPFGFQPDVFDSVPGEQSYSPLREVVKVTWSDTAKPRVLRSVEDIEAARRSSELTIEQTGVVVNMPMLKWPGGER